MNFYKKNYKINGMKKVAKSSKWENIRYRQNGYGKFDCQI